MANKKVNEENEVLKLNLNNAEQSNAQETKEIYVTPEMSQAIDVLFQAVEMGRKAAVYSFQDAAYIGQAIQLLEPYRTK